MKHLGSLLNLLQTVTHSKTTAQFIDQGELKIVIEQNDQITAILFATVFDLDIRNKLRLFVTQFMERFSTEIGKWFGDASQFGAAIELIPLVFGDRLPSEMLKGI